MTLRNKTSLDGLIDHLESFRDGRAITSNERPYRPQLAIVNALKAAGQTWALAVGGEFNSQVISIT